MGDPVNRNLVLRRSFTLPSLVAVALTLACCTRDPSSRSDCRCQPSGAPVSPGLLAYLSRARAAHHLADAHEAQGNLSAAALELDRLVASPRPVRAEVYAEVNEVLADTHARLADLRSRLDDFRTANQHVRLGLVSARAPSYFRGHLFEVLGLVNERESAALGAKGKSSEAEAARQRALDALERAMKIQDAVILEAVKQREMRQ